MLLSYCTEKAIRRGWQRGDKFLGCQVPRNRRQLVKSVIDETVTWFSDLLRRALKIVFQNDIAMPWMMA